MVEPRLLLVAPGRRADQDTIGYSGWSFETASRPGSRDYVPGILADLPSIALTDKNP